MTAPHDVVFLLDVDNTLLDNDRIIADLRPHLERQFGAANAGRYWTLFEELRTELGYADYLGALQRYRSDSELRPGDDSRLLQMSSFLVDYPFADRLYPRAPEVIERLTSFRPTVILSDHAGAADNRLSATRQATTRWTRPASPPIRPPTSASPASATCSMSTLACC